MPEQGGCNIKMDYKRSGLVSRFLQMWQCSLICRTWRRKTLSESDLYEMDT